MQIGIISLFPEWFQAMQIGIIGKAIQKKIVTIDTQNPREFADNTYGRIDAPPYGGGAGLILQAPPLIASINALKQKIQGSAKVIYVSPQGKLFNQQAAFDLAKSSNLIFLAGRYEGIDERVMTHVDEEWSIGDYILTGGEMAILVMLDAIIRVLPGVVGDPESVQTDSFSNGLLKYPQYTRPEIVEDNRAPEILLSGNHAAIAAWREAQSQERTQIKRPDLWEKSHSNGLRKKSD